MENMVRRGRYIKRPLCVSIMCEGAFVYLLRNILYIYYYSMYIIFGQEVVLSKASLHVHVPKPKSLKEDHFHEFVKK